MVTETAHNEGTKRPNESETSLVAEGVTDPRAIAAAQQYDKRLAEIGRLIRVEPYRNSMTPIMHRCIKHGLVSQVIPANALKGRGMMCCKQEAQKADAQRRSREAADRYDKTIAQFGKLRRLDPYKDCHTPILHLCLIHNERHKTAPSRAINGGGLVCCRREAVQATANKSMEKAAAEYDAKLAVVGKLRRIEPYQGAHVGILHECIAHKERGKIRPGNALSGYGLKCCKIAAIKNTGMRLREEAAKRYDERIAVFGKLKRLEPYIDSQTPILHRCLVHEEEGRTAPNDSLAGKGLRCCQKAAQASRVEAQRQDAARTYDSRIAEFGRVIRLEPYDRSGTPILHRCLAHGEEHKATPDAILSGGGLTCCALASKRATQQRRNREAAERYDELLSEVGRLVRVETYINRTTPILHRCLDHDEVHAISPGNALQGAGIRCCRRGGWDCLQSLLDGNDLRPVMGEATFVYVFDVPGHQGWLKPGISNDPEVRARNPQSDGIYGELMASWELPNRTAAILVEEAVLRDKSIPRPDDLGELLDAHGSKEIRIAEANQLIKHIQNLVDSLEAFSGTWQGWALGHLPRLSRWEERLLRQQADEKQHK